MSPTYMLMRLPSTPFRGRSHLSPLKPVSHLPIPHIGYITFWDFPFPTHVFPKLQFCLNGRLFLGIFICVTITFTAFYINVTEFGVIRTLLKCGLVCCLFVLDKGQYHSLEISLYLLLFTNKKTES